MNPGPAGVTGPAVASAGGDGEVPPPDDLLQLRDIRVRFDLRRGGLSRKKVGVYAVDGVSLSVERGRTLGLVGSTGSGKSTVAHVVVGMVAPTSGSVTIAGHDVSRARGSERRALQRLVQVVLQDPYSSLDPRMKVRDIIAEPLTLGRSLNRGAAKTAIDERVAELLGLVGLRPEKAELYPHQFSGGQRQRIAIARALAPRPALIVLDEPTSALDVSVRAQILNLLKSLQEQLGVTYLVISHDLVTVAYLASTLAVMHHGRIVEIGPTASLYRAPRHPCTVELLASAPGATGGFLTGARRDTVPAASLPATACRFAFRCPLRIRLGEPARCLEEDPVLTQVELDHQAACHFPEAVLDMAQTVQS